MRNAMSGTECSGIVTGTPIEIGGDHASSTTSVVPAFSASIASRNIC